MTDYDINPYEAVRKYRQGFVKPVQDAVVYHGLGTKDVIVMVSLNGEQQHWVSHWTDGPDMISVHGGPQPGTTEPAKFDAVVVWG